MNPQYNGQMRAPGPFMPPYSQPYQAPYNQANSFDSHSGAAVNKGFPPPNFGNPTMQNGPSTNFPGPMQNQSSSHMQPTHPSANLINNQMSHDFNAMQLTQNQNHPLLTNAHPTQRHPGMPEPQPSQPPNSMPGQQNYWAQPPVPDVCYQNTPSSYTPNANTAPYTSAYNTDLHPAPPSTNNNALFSNSQHSDRMMPPPPPPAMSNQIHPSKAPGPDAYMPPPGPRPQQMRQPGPYTNGTGIPDRSSPMPSMNNQYSQVNSNMSNRYPPSPSPVMNQSGSIPPGPGPQYGQPPNNHVLPPQNRISSQPPPPQQSRRLDPDNMPSPIQVIEDDRKLRSSPFSTAQRGLVPPLVTTKFTVIDEGFCSPRYVRSTIYNVPTTAEVLKQTYVPFALTISPFARIQEGEHPPPIIDPGEDGPVRCHRCRAYMSPFMQFIDAGRRFQCMLCKTTSEVPGHYFTHLDHLGQRVDRLERPELCMGSYEFIVNKDYCKEGKFPNCPAFIFLIDVSYNSMRSGMAKTLCENMKSILARLPCDEDEERSKLRVGFVTYSTAVHFYNLNSSLAQPQMLVVSDVQDMFMPLLDGFLVDPIESAHVIDSLMEQIPTMFAETKETETILGPAIQAGLEALKAAECAGKLFVFHTTLPIAEAPGKLKNRDDRKLLGTEKEKAILTPQIPFYNNLGQECVKAGCSVDLFLFNNAYIDVATVGQVCRLTGGQIFKYTYFQADIDGVRFIEDLWREIEKPIAFDAVLRVRTSTGIRPTDFMGSFFMSNTTDVELASCSCDHSLAAEVKYDDKLAEEEGACVQVAVLYTSCGGRRRLRVHNLALGTCAQMAELFRNCELDAMLNFFLKEGVRKVSDENPKCIKEYLVNRSAQILACYRKHCAQASSAGQLILPECMKLLPLYVNCLVKCDALAGGQEISTDDRSFIMLTALNMDVDSSAAYLYPRLLPLHDIKPQSEQAQLPTAIRCSLERLKDHGVYLLENGLRMFLWIGLNADPEWIQDVFGVSNINQIDPSTMRLMPLNTALSQSVRSIVSQVQTERQRRMKMYICLQGDKLELMFRQLLVEDRTTEGSASYVDFLCHLHKEIRTLLS